MFYWKMYIPLVFKIMVIASCLSILITVATFFFKISAHAVGVGGLAGILVSLAMLSSPELTMPALAAIVLAGLTMSSRLMLNVHTLREVSWGGTLGFFVAIIGVMVIF